MADVVEEFVAAAADTDVSEDDEQDPVTPATSQNTATQAQNIEPKLCLII